MFEQFLNHIKRNNLCSPSDAVLLAVSGGIDSMVMLHLFKEAGMNVAVAHCNFQLRGKESDDDEVFVKTVCQDSGVTVFTTRFQTESFAWENGLSIQMAARDLRYDWFRKVLEQNSFSSVATAHHFDDSMETILLNLTKGSGVDGFAGIPVRNGRIIRPILFATRAQIEQYARERNVVWREDHSNLTDDYQRNYIRHHVIPKLQELNPSLAETWRHGIEKIQGDLAFLRHAHAKWKNEFVDEAPGKIIIQKRAFDDLPAGASTLWRYIKIYSFNFDQASEIIAARHGQPGKRFLSPTHMLVIDRDTFIISPYSADWNAIDVKREDHEVTLGTWKLYLSSGDLAIPSMDKMEAVVDADVLKFPLTWRKWKNGDSFHPLGMNHKKKLSDFFVDNKLSLIDKNSATVLESDGNIVYVVGWRIDDRFKITEATKRVLHIQAAKI